MPTSKIVKRTLFFIFLVAAVLNARYGGPVSPIDDPSCIDVLNPSVPSETLPSQDDLKSKVSPDQTTDEVIVIVMIGVVILFITLNIIGILLIYLGL